MKKLFFLFVTLFAVVFFVSCGLIRDTSSGLADTLASGPAGGTSAASDRTTPFGTTEPPLVFDTSPIPAEEGEPMRLHWNPYRLSPLIRDADPAIRDGMEEMMFAILNRRALVTFSSEAVRDAVLANVFHEFPPAALVSSFAPEGTTVHIAYRLPRAEHLAALDAFGRAVEEAIASTVLVGDSDTLKALLLFHYVASHVDYFTRAYEHWQTNAFFALTDGQSICYGFSDAYNYLLLQVGIDAWLVQGNSRYYPYDAHGWSMIALDGGRYFCDATWESSGTDGKWFSYFGQTSMTRRSSLALDEAFIGEGALSVGVPTLTDRRFERMFEYTFFVPDSFTVDREAGCLVAGGRRYYYN